MSLRPRLTVVDWGTRFRALRGVAANPLRVLKQVGALLKSRARQAFQDQGRPAGSWPEQTVPNVPGILMDFHGGAAKPKSRRFDARPALIDTHLLQKAIDFQMVGRAGVEIGVHGPAHAYAAKQQFGLKSQTLPVTEEFQDWLYRWLKTSSGSRWKSRLGWLLNKKFTGERLEWRPRPRPFLVLLPQDVADVAELAGVEIVGAASAAPGTT